MQVLEKLSEGESQKEIADHLDCAPGTVDAHLKKIKEKTGFHKNTELVALWYSAHSSQVLAKIKRAIPMVTMWAGFFVLALLSLFAPESNVETHITDNPGTGGLEGLFLLIIVVAAIAYIFQDEKS